MKNGIELLLTMQLALELMDEYNLKGNVKNKANLFKRSIEKEVSNAYDNIYGKDEQMMLNAMNMKNRMISQIASLSEDECIVFSQYVNNFFENKEESLRNTEVSMTKI